MTTRKSSWRVLGLVAAVLALFMMTIGGAYSAPGGTPGKPPGVGGGGGNEPPTEEVGNSLSVPAVFVPDSSSFASLTCPSVGWAPSTVVGNDTSVFPTDFSPALETQDDGTPTPTGLYYVQGEDTWQAGCAVAAVNTLTATAAFGDNIAGGDAAFKVGSPVRVEVGLEDDNTLGLSGYTVYKLTNELDRVATYGTQGTAVSPYGELRVWAADAQFKIEGPAPVPLQTMVAEINSTGRVVYGYNWRPSQEGVYTITFTAPSVGVTAATAVVDVTASAGGGGGGGHGGGGGGGPH